MNLHLGSMSHVHQSCLSKWITSKHKDMLNDRRCLFLFSGCQYPWRKLPELKWKICKGNYKYSLKRKLKIRKSDFTLVFLVLAQSIIFIMDLFYNVQDTSVKCCVEQNQWSTNWYSSNFTADNTWVQTTKPFKVILVYLTYLSCILV